MGSNPLNPSFRKLHIIPQEAAHPLVRQAIRDNDKSITTLNQAIETLKGQITAATNTAAAASITQDITTEQVADNLWLGLGTVNDETGENSYTTQQSDDGAFLVFSDAFPIAVTLSNPTAPYFLFVQNWGGGVVTFTPFSGTISYIGNLGAASMPLKQGYSTMIVWDGSSWWAQTLPIVPQSFAVMAGEYLTGYNALTGTFSASTIPHATDSTFGIVQPDNSTTVIDSTSGLLRTNGLSVTVTTAALTALGAQGSMTYVRGLLVSQVQAT